jgi:integrase/recombinase XerD
MSRTSTPLSRNPDSLAGLAELFYEWMQVTNYSKYSIRSRRQYLNTFFLWCGERGLFMPADITKPIVERYQRHLFHYRKKNNKPLSFKSQHARLDAIRSYFKWLARNNYILSNPASDIDMPRIGTQLPRDVLTIREVEKVINQLDRHASSRADQSDALHGRS